jgi:hypothetical protein
MSKHGALPEIVILPDEDMETLALTLESLAEVMPKASIHVVRPCILGADPIAELVGRAGLQVIDASADDGFDRLLVRLDRRFGTQRWCWLFAGEVLSPHHANTLLHGGQLAMDPPFAWLQLPSPLAAPRVRAGGQPLRVSRCAELAPFLPTPSWRDCFLRGVRAAISSYEEIYEDVCLLTHLGELDAAYQRAEQSWGPAEGDVKMHLARAATMLAQMLGVSATSIPACAHWFSVEPEPFVAMTYIRAASGSVPFSLIDRLLSIIPTFGPVIYRDSLAFEPYENVLTLRHAIERERLSAKARRDSVVRMVRVGAATAGEIGHALSLSFLLDDAPAKLIAALPDGEQDAMLGDCVNVNLDAEYIAASIGAFASRFRGQAWLSQLVQRFVLSRNVEATLALDACGVVGFDHWTMLGTAVWMPSEVRAKALVRAVVHGEIDPAEAEALARGLDDADRSLFAAAMCDARAELAAARDELTEAVA